MVNFFTARCCGIYYYIAVYIQLTLIAPLIIKLVNSKFRGVGWVITPAAIIVQYIMILAGKPISFPWSANNLFIWFIYYYIGILLGNNLIKYKINMAKTTIFLFICIAVQFFEAQLWYLYGDYGMATTQIKLTSMLTSIAVIFLSYSWMKIDSKQTGNKYILIIHKFLLITGDCSFGIYLSHVLVMYVLTKIFPLWNVLIFPLNSIFILMLTLLCVLTGRKILGKKLSKYMGLT
ncbi:MAG: acyltransferase family protein [Eubacteriaceae bacterium]